MHDLIPLGPALPGALTPAEKDAITTMAYAGAEKAPTSRASLADCGRSAVLRGIPSAVVNPIYHRPSGSQPQP